MSIFDILTPGSVAQDPHDRWRWATVISITPLTVRLDGDTTPIPVTSTLVNPLSLVIGNRVWCQLFGQRLIVLGMGGGSGDIAPVVPLPPLQVAHNLVAGQEVVATAWADMPGIAVLNVDTPSPLVVEVNYAGWLTAPTGASSHVRGSVALGGATTQAMQWGQRLMASGDDKRQVVSNSFHAILNPGVTSFTYQAYKSGSATATLEYAYMEVVPVRWASPGEVYPVAADPSDTPVVLDGWTALPLHPNVLPFNPASPPRYIIKGGMATVTGIVRPATAAAANALQTDAGMTIATLPGQIVPENPDALISVQQGFNKAHWFTSLAAPNLLNGSRYGQGNPSTSTWLPFSHTYAV